MQRRRLLKKRWLVAEEEAPACPLCAGSVQSAFNIAGMSEPLIADLFIKPGDSPARPCTQRVRAGGEPHNSLSNSCGNVLASLSSLRRLNVSANRFSEKQPWLARLGKLEALDISW